LESARTKAENSERILKASEAEVTRLLQEIQALAEKRVKIESKEREINKIAENLELAVSAMEIELTCYSCLNSLEDAVTMVACGHNY
jgi:predicted metalloenzyme YecM